MLGKTVWPWPRGFFPAYILNMVVHTDPGVMITTLQESPLAYHKEISTHH